MLREKRAFILIVIVSLLVISGCLNQRPTGDQQPTGSPVPPAIPTATAVPTPAPGTNVEILNVPATAAPGKAFAAVWRVNSPDERNIQHTAVHYGPQPESEPLTLTSYPNLTPVQSGTIPANFTTFIIINSTGNMYFRAHAIIEGVNYWSSEKIIVVSSLPTITVTAIPNRVVENTNYSIRWNVSGGTAGDISKTDLIWDFKKGNASVSDYSRYTPSMTGRTPMEFSQTLRAPQSGTIYFRVHAVVDGIEIFSDEKQIIIYPEYTSGY